MFEYWPPKNDRVVSVNSQSKGHYGCRTPLMRMTVTLGVSSHQIPKSESVYDCSDSLIASAFAPVCAFKSTSFVFPLIFAWLN